MTLAQPYTRVELEFLSIYHPNADEAQDAKLFGKNLRQHMANALKVPTSDLTFAEAKEKYAKKLKRMESMKKDKNCWKMIMVKFCKNFVKMTILYYCDQRYYFDIYKKV